MKINEAPMKINEAPMKISRSQIFMGGLQIFLCQVFSLVCGHSSRLRQRMYIYAVSVCGATRMNSGATRMNTLVQGQHNVTH